MIGKTAIDEHMKNAKLLFDSVAWLESHTPIVKKTILDLIRKDQLTDEGVDENENIIGTYSFYTEFLSNGKKKEGEPYDLHDTGQFYKSMFIKVLKDSIIIDADFEKMEDQNWWRISILGLTEENLDKYAAEIKSNYILYARRVLGIN